MSLSVCVQGLVAEGRISKGMAEEAERLYSRFYHQLKHTTGPSAAATEASERAMAAIQAQLLRKKRLSLLQVQAQAKIVENARTVYAGGTFADGPISGEALLAHLVRSEKGNGIANVELQTRVILNEARRLNGDLLLRYRRNLLGEVRHKAEQLDLARALHGEKVDDLNVRELAEAAGRTNEMLRSRFNQAGGDIPKLEGWGLPHSHDAYRVGAVTPEAWIAEVMPALDRSRMIDWETGLPMDDETLEAMLRGAYDSIVTGGADEMTPGAGGSRSWANRFGEHRVLHFRDAEAWMAYNDRFGTGTVIDALNGHWESMARSIAGMEVLGPNPDATVRWMIDLVDQEAKTKGGLQARAGATVRGYEIEKTWAEIRGDTMRRVRRPLALFSASLRNWGTATSLGFAPISALSDHGMRLVTRIFSNTPMFQLPLQYARQIAPFIGRGDRDFARRYLIISDELAGRMAGYGRLHLDDMVGGRLSQEQWGLTETAEATYEATRRLADGLLRLGGLNAHTIGNRETGAMEFTANLSHWAARGWGDLPPFFRQMMERGGFDAAEWDALRSAPRTQFRGMDWLLPDTIPDRALREKLMRLMFTQVDLGTPTADLMMTALTRANPAGTVSGELTRFSLQFMTFPLTVMAQHGRRLMAETSWQGKAGYAVAFLGATTLFGYASLQLTEILQGRDPLPATPETMARATQKGGGLGPFGDAMMLSRNEFGQSTGDLVMGRAWGTVDNVSKGAWAVADTGIAAMTDDPADDEAAAKARGQAVSNLLRRETPVINQWYTRLAYERLFVEWAAEAASGQSRERSHAAAMRYHQQRGTQYWAAPGTAPGEWRAPDLGNALRTSVAE